MLLTDKEVILVGGKGGVGKTTMAASIGLMAAQRGRRTLVVSTDPAHSLADAYGVSIGDQETPLADNLWGLEIDPDREVQAHVQRVASDLKQFTRPQMYAEIERQMRLTAQSPGAQEAALLERIARLLEHHEAYDLIIFDTAPTGHTLRLMSLPEAMAAWTQGLLKHDAKSKQLAGVLDHLSPKSGKDVANPMGDPQADATAGMSARSQAIGERLQARQRLFKRARRLFTDRKRCAIVFVLTPEKLPLLETQRSVKALAAEQLSLAGLIVNRVIPEAADGQFMARQRALEAPYLKAIEDSFARLPRHYVLWQDINIEGLQGLRRVQTLLADSGL